MPLRRTLATLSLASMAAGGGLTLTAASPAGAAAKTTTITAVETDFHIALSKSSLSPGHYVFVAKNKGQTTHALEITGPGLKKAETKDLSPGQSAQLKVTLKNGKYDVFCPVPGHKALGMNVNVVVKVSGGSSTTATTAKPSGGYGY